MTQESAPNGSVKMIKIVVAAGLVLAGSYGVYSIMGGKSNVQESQKVAEVNSSRTTAEPNGITKKLSKGTMKAFVIHSKRKDIAPFTFKDGKGNELTLDKWKGRVVLLNVWATWCAPCRKEMPYFAALQTQLGGDDFEVVAISVDRKGVKASGKFLTEVKATVLNLYIDKSTRVIGKLQAIGLPLTILIDRSGKEIGRLTGPAEWHSPDAIRLIKSAIAEK